MFRATLKERGQITIPAKVRKNLLLNPGDLLEVTVKEGSIILRPLQVVGRAEDKAEDKVEGAEGADEEPTE